MITEVWTRGTGAVPGKLIWRGEISAMPHKGDYVVLIDGWASELVRDVDYSLYDNSVCITLEVSETSEYPEVTARAGEG